MLRLALGLVAFGPAILIFVLASFGPFGFFGWFEGHAAFSGSFSA